jgi:hypothetical protein
MKIFLIGLICFISAISSAQDQRATLQMNRGSYVVPGSIKSCAAEKEGSEIFNIMGPWFDISKFSVTNHSTQLLVMTHVRISINEGPWLYSCIYKGADLAATGLGAIKPFSISETNCPITCGNVNISRPGIYTSKVEARGYFRESNGKRSKIQLKGEFLIKVPEKLY